MDRTSDGAPKKNHGPVETFGLAPEWVRELRDTVRPNKLEPVMGMVSKALDAFSAEDYVRASSLATEAKADATRSPRIRELLGLSFYQQDRWQDAARELLTYRRLTGNQDQHHVIADCYRALERPDRAIEICAEVEQGVVEPEIWSEVVMVGASALADKNDLDRALAFIARGELRPRSIEPHHLRLWYVYADLLERAGKKAEARRIWESISAEDPEFFDVYERLQTSGT